MPVRQFVQVPPMSDSSYVEPSALAPSSPESDELAQLTAQLAACGPGDEPLAVYFRGRIAELEAGAPAYQSAIPEPWCPPDTNGQSAHDGLLLGAQLAALVGSYLASGPGASRAQLALALRRYEAWAGPAGWVPR